MIHRNKETYKRRQAIVEHTYGIIKRQWGFYYIMTKRGIERAAADVHFMFAALNLRRIFNLLDRNLLLDYLRSLGIIFFAILEPIRFILSQNSNFHAWHDFHYSAKTIR